jgi:hypothetical protein
LFSSLFSNNLKTLLASGVSTILVAHRLRSVCLLTAVFALVNASSCNRENLGGSLTVRHLSEGSYEIYKIASESPLQFVSETRSKFNERVLLMPGSYLVLADCSSELVNIYPKSDINLVAHQVNFVPLQPTNPDDKFSIQCIRSERTRSRQNLINQFSLAVLSGVRDLLVGMTPLRLDLTPNGLNAQPSESKVISQVLSSISVESAGKEPYEDFFLSPVGGINPFTENQKPGAKLFVLKGSYNLQLNGTSMEVTLAEGETKNVVPATFTVSTSSKVDLLRAEKIRGAPLFAELNGEHYMSLNTIYPVLPGEIQVRLATSLRPAKFEAKEGENLKIHARNVQVELGCEQEDWGCLGSRKVRLFEKGKNYHFAESQTDVPILFLEKDVSVGVEGSRNIKQNLSAADDQRLKVGFLEVTPTPTFKPGVLTDLMRVEAKSPNSLIGASLDMVLDKQTLMPLFVGLYNLSQYSFITSDGSRRKSPQSFYISPGKTVKLEVNTYLTEKKMSAISSPNDDSSRQ